MIWDALTAISSTISMIAFILTAVYIRAQLRGLDKDRYLAISNELFTTWQSREFMEAQLWLLHRLGAMSWPEFIAAHRGDVGEVAFHRVGSFYDRVGTLVRLGLIDDREILSTIGGYAIAVWNKIEPLVREARRIENSTLFDDFERLLPSCHECYVPTLERGGRVNPFSIIQPDEKISLQELKRQLDAGKSLTILDVRAPSQVTEDRRTLPQARLLPLDQVESHSSELPTDREVVVYCACPSEATSGHVAQMLRERGYRASALTGGYDAWRKAGLPLVPV